MATDTSQELYEQLRKQAGQPGMGWLNQVADLLNATKPLLTLNQLQDEVLTWQQHNFPRTAAEGTAWVPLMGAVEEVGELAHVHLKAHQGIRGYDDPDKVRDEGMDAVGDTLVYLADYCNMMGWSMQEAIETTWDRVSKRDWQADPSTGGDPDDVC